MESDGARISRPLAVSLASVATLLNGSVVMQIQRRLVTKKELRQYGVPYSFVHLQRLEDAGDFPKRIKLSQNRVVWYLHEIEEWVADKAALRSFNLKHSS